MEHTEIELQPAISEKKVKAELLLNGRVVHKLPSITIGQPLKWSRPIICDVYSDSCLEIVVYERRHGIYREFKSEQCLVSDVVQLPIKALKLSIGDKKCTIFINFLDQIQAEMLFNKGIEKLRKMERLTVGSESSKLGKAGPIFKAMLQFGDAVADVIPIAKTIFAVCTCALEEIENQGKYAKELDNLIGRLVGMVSLVDEVKDHTRQSSLQQSIEEFLYLIEDVSIFDMGYESKGSMGANPPFMWIYGQAGIGKSTISTSVCNRLTERGAPVISFFCKRDDPARRDPLRLINSVVYGLACRCPPYGKLVAAAIEANSELCTSHLGIRYDELLKKLLGKTKSFNAPYPYVVLVDAMDECGSNESRKQILGYLRELSSLVPWLKVIVTSRPDDDIRTLFSHCPSTSIKQFPLHDYAAAGDIRAFIEARLGALVGEAWWPADGIDRLCAHAREVFIWASTACKFIADGLDKQGRLDELMHENPSGGALSGLDSLYVVVVNNSLMDRSDDNIAYMRQCIGAIVVTSMKQPVPTQVLCELMRAHVKPEVLKGVIDRLRAVLYIDETQDAAIRVYHPSFADFALDMHRSGDFWVEPIRRNIELLDGCLLTMEYELRFNICELETSHLLNQDVPNLESKIKAKISGQLAYSCTYWISHLIEGMNQKLALPLVANIILAGGTQSTASNECGTPWATGIKSMAEETDAASVWDAYRFVFAFFDPIAASTPHIYISALAFAPEQSEIYRRLAPLFPNIATVTKGGDEAWPGWLRSISHPDLISSLCVSPNGRLLVTGCHDGSFAGDGTIELTISPDSSLIVSASTTGEVQLWDANTGSSIDRIQIENPHNDFGFFQALAFSPEGTTIRMLTRHKSASSTRMIIWDTNSKTTAHEAFLDGDTEPIAVAFSPDGDHIAISYDGRLVLRSNMRATIDLDIESEPNVITFSPDGTLVASNSTPGKCEVQMWDVKTGTAVCGVLIGHNLKIYSIGFSLDGMQVVTGSEDWTVRLWDTKTGSAIRGPFLGHSDDVRTVAFSPDGICIISGSRDKMVLIWDATTSNSINIPVTRKSNPAILVSPRRQAFTDTYNSRTSGDSIRNPDHSPYGHSSITTRYVPGMLK
ncbi:hypothetical protein B0J17DRAFT_712978 [Rhizoctonia solani]|nr:hypothetical protein B0J17DRAFT_712978 [Rhizoctonia solani]